MTHSEDGAPADSEQVAVLLVDPDREFAELAAAFLREASPHLSTTVVTSGGAAMDHLERAAVDCVVSEDGLPDRSGLQLLEAVRARHPELPFVLFTGDGSETLASEAIAAGVTDYLPKGDDAYGALPERIGDAVANARGDPDQVAFREIVETFPHPVYVIDADGILRVCNEALADLHGTTQAKLEGSHMRSFLDEDVAEQLFADMEAVFEAEERSMRVEREVHDGAGNPRWIEGWLVEHDLPDGSRGVIGTSIDLTHREQRERELEDMRLRQEAAIEAGAIGTWEWDIEADEIMTNPAFARTFGIEPEAAREGVPLQEYIDAIHPDDRARVEAAIEEALDANTEYHEEYRVRGSDGGLRWVSARGHVETDETGNPTVFRGAVTEITDRKERERQLEALNRRNSEMVSAATPEEVLQLGVDAATEILGLDVNGIFLHDEAGGSLVPDVVSERAATRLADVPSLSVEDSNAGRAYRSQEALGLDELDGAPDVIDGAAVPRDELYLPLGEHGVLIAGTTDDAGFDREDRMLGELLASNITAALEQVFRTQELEARERELSAQYQRLDEFTNVVSHDLRNPLNVAMGRLELVREERDSKHLAEIARAHDRMKALIEHLLTLAHRDAEIEATECIELSELAQSCWEFVPTSDATLAVEADIAIAGDRTRLRQLFENLYRNAIEHGGEDVRVTVGELEDGFFVADDGPGIPDADGEDIFQAGFSGQGTGYGLAIVKQVAEAHGWAVELVEGADGGARFEFRTIETFAGDRVEHEIDDQS